MTAHRRPYRRPRQRRTLRCDVRNPTRGSGASVRGSRRGRESRRQARRSPVRFTMRSFLRGISSCALLLAIAACRRPPAPHLDAAASDAAAAADAGDGVVLSMSPVAMEDAFRANLAGLIVAQVSRGDWAAFLPEAGVTWRTSACASLAEASGTLTRPRWTRSCTAREVNEAHSDLLRTISRDLTSEERREYDGGFTCVKETCSLHLGEIGFNGEVVFARAGERVRLVSVTESCGGAIDESTRRAIVRANRAAPAPPRCRP